MKSYKEYEVKHIGSSDVGGLVMFGGGVHGADFLKFGGDGSYKAYIVDDEAKIGDHYELVASYVSWFKLYDDEDLTIKLQADIIYIYRAGDFGCIIQLVN